MALEQGNSAGNIRRRLNGEVRVDLFELDYSRQVGLPGDPAYVERFVDDLQTDRQPVVHDGDTYLPLPIKMEGLERKAEGTTARPALRIANAGGVVTSLIDSVPGQLVGAILTRRTIYARHLDDGDSPDPQAVWEPIQRWQLEQKVGENLADAGFELSAPVDVQGLELPLRRIQGNICPLIYKGEGCFWNPGAGPYLDASNQVVGTVGEDSCALDLFACRARFASRNQPLNFGGFVATSRVLR